MPNRNQLVIRLRRKGRVNYRIYDVIVTHKHKATGSGYCKEKLGFYNPNWRENMAWLNMDRIYFWLSKGAEPVGALAKLIMQFDLNTRKDQSWQKWETINPQRPPTDWRIKHFNPFLYPRQQTEEGMKYWKEYAENLQVNLRDGVTIQMEKQKSQVLGTEKKESETSSK
eukprot:TRINITY_DN387_c0_g1_i1.p1 TRINITY_DN387_c0_g1~~TRINITY_DN387_c0_g1_i1.p1  ORF type:complete len:169 (+),score=26.62 TRINITY_DN387_c0_g1_i1:41-547(+)